VRFSKVLYVVLVYLSVAEIALPENIAKLIPSWLNPWSLQITWWVVLFAAGVLVIADAVRAGLRNDARRLLRSMAWFKFALVPFFLVNFLYIGVIVLGLSLAGGAVTVFGALSDDPARAALTLGIFGTLTVWAIAAIAALLTYAIFLPTSADGIAFLVVLRRRRQIGVLPFILHLVLYLLFVADLVSTVILLVTYWKKIVSGGDGTAAGPVEAAPEDHGVLLLVAEGVVEADDGRVGPADHDVDLRHPAGLDPMLGGGHELAADA